MAKTQRKLTDKEKLERYLAKEELIMAESLIIVDDLDRYDSYNLDGHFEFSVQGSLIVARVVLD